MHKFSQILMHKIVRQDFVLMTKNILSDWNSFDCIIPNQVITRLHTFAIKSSAYCVASALSSAFTHGSFAKALN